jgi:hypothetical protein
MYRHSTRCIDTLEWADKQSWQDLTQCIKELVMTFDYILANEAYKALPALLLRDHGLQVIGRLKRGYAIDAEGNAYEVNILAKPNGMDNGSLSSVKAKRSCPSRRLPLPAPQAKTVAAHLRHGFPDYRHPYDHQPRCRTLRPRKGVAVYYS